VGKTAIDMFLFIVCGLPISAKKLSILLKFLKMQNLLPAYMSQENAVYIIDPLFYARSLFQAQVQTNSLTTSLSSNTYNNKKKGAPPELTCTKATIMEKISEEINQPPYQAKDTVETLLEIMKSTLASGEDVMISDFGKFQVNEKSPRKGKNPATGEAMKLQKRMVVTLKLASKLRDKIN